MCLPSVSLAIISSPEPQSPLWSSRCNNPSLRAGFSEWGVPRSAAAAPPVNLLEMQLFDLTPGPGTGTPGVGSVMDLCLRSSARRCLCRSGVRPPESGGLLEDPCGPCVSLSPGPSLHGGSVNCSSIEDTEEKTFPVVTGWGRGTENAASAFAVTMCGCGA